MTKRDVLMNRKWASQLGMLPQMRVLGEGEHAVVVEVDVDDWPAFAAELTRWGTVAFETISSLGGGKDLYAVAYVEGADDRELEELSQRVGLRP